MSKHDDGITPAVAEGEVRLTQAEIKALLAVERDEEAITVVERILTERLRAVEVERDAARAQRDGRQRWAERNFARAESTDAAHVALVAGLEALMSDGMSGGYWTDGRGGWVRGVREDRLRALLPTSDREGDPR